MVFCRRNKRATCSEGKKDNNIKEEQKKYKKKNKIKTTHTELVAMSTEEAPREDL